MLNECTNKKASGGWQKRFQLALSDLKLESSARLFSLKYDVTCFSRIVCFFLTKSFLFTFQLKTMMH